jgi:hypothetical protein
VDGGYNKEAFLVDPMSQGCGRNEIIWSEWLESIRKDVECTFGMLKQRFRFFLNSIQYHSFFLIENAFKCACMLHNMMITYNGMDIFEWEKTVDWSTVDPDLEDDAYEEEKDDSTLPDEDIGEEYLPLQPAPIITHTTLPGRQFNASSAADYIVLRERLVTHFRHNYELGMVRWPGRSTVAQRFRMRIPRLPRILRNETQLCLYTKPSDFRLIESLNGNDRIGRGLFSCLQYKRNDVVAQYRGVYVDLDAYLITIQAQPNRKGYGILSGDGRVLDCYDYYLSGACLANNALGCTNITTGMNAVCNCIMIFEDNRILLVCNTVVIPPNTELALN